MRKAILIIAGCLVVTTFARNDAPQETDAAQETAPEFSVDFKKEKSEEVIAAEEILILPGYTAAADSKVRNNGKHDANVFIKVDVPVLDSTAVDLEKDVEIRPDGFVSVMGYTPEPPWTLVEEKIENGILTQVFSYGDLIPLHPGQETPPLFTEWSVVNVRVVGEKSKDVDWSTIETLCPQTAITVYSIQTGMGSSPDEVWKMVH